MILNAELRDVVRRLYLQTIEAFKQDGTDFASLEFLSSFSYEFIPHESDPTRTSIVSAAFSAPLKQKIELNIKALYANSSGLTLEGYLCEAVNDFLNYIIPRAAGLAEANEIFDEHYEYFDQSLYGETCLVTTFSLLENVSDNQGRVVLPDPFSLKYLVNPLGGRAETKALRDHAVPGFEIKMRAHPIGHGREIKDCGVFFVLEHSSFLPINKNLIPAAIALGEDIAKKFILATRLVGLSTAFSDYRGYRMTGALSGYQMNIMNFPDDFVKSKTSSELGEYNSLRLRQLLPRLAAMKYDDIFLLDTKLDDILRRSRQTMLGQELTDLKVAIEKLLDCFQILEAILGVEGSEYIALYSAVLLTKSGHSPFPPLSTDPYEIYRFIKRMFGLRNAVVHGRMVELLNPKKQQALPSEVDGFLRMVNHLALLFILNGKLKEAATKLAVGSAAKLEFFDQVSREEMNAIRKPTPTYPSW